MAEYTHIDRQEVNSPSSTGNAKKILLSYEDCARINLENISAYFRTHKPKTPRSAVSLFPQHIKFDLFHFTKDKDVTVFLHTDETIYDRERTQRRYTPHKLHDHDFYELNVICRGSAQNYMLDTCIKQDSSKILLMSPYAWHYAKVCSEDTLLFNIMIRREFSPSSPFGVHNLLFSSGLNLSPLLPYSVFTNTPETEFLIHEILHEFYSDLPMSQELIKADLLKLFTLFGRQLLTPSASHTYPVELHRVFLYIREHYATATLHEAANLLNFSEGYLSRFVKKYTGCSFNEIVFDIRMQNAATHLKFSNYTVTEISDMVGYSDLSYFRKLFKKKYQMSPNVYRKMYREDNRL